MSTVPDKTAADFEAPPSGSRSATRPAPDGTRRRRADRPDRKERDRHREVRRLRVLGRTGESDGVDTTDRVVELRCTGYALEEWHKREKPEADDLVSIQLAGSSTPARTADEVVRDRAPSRERSAVARRRRLFGRRRLQVLAVAGDVADT